MALTPGGTPYVESSDLVADYPTVSLALAEHIDTLRGGMVLLNNTALTGSSVSIDNVFTSDYRAYRVIAYVPTTSTNTFINIRTRVGGSDLTTSTYLRQDVQGSTTTASAVSATVSSIQFGTSAASTYSLGTWDLIDIFETRLSLFVGNVTHETAIISQRWAVNNTVSYDGLTIFPTSGNMNNGFISIYGYAE
jgi:hypothetical protein